MYRVDGTRITLTRGDSFYATVGINNANGEPYDPQEGDIIRFGLKVKATDSDCLITKVIPNDTLVLALAPEDTKALPFGKYVYDIELTFANGDIDTFINNAELSLIAEVI